MFLKSLTLSNIRSYTSANVQFPKGAVLLSGDIGSGKTTLLLAIEFALFGIMRSEVSGSGLLRNGENEGKVSLTFIIANNEYVIERTLKRAKRGVVQDSGTLTTNGVMFEGTPVELKAKIIEILGYPISMVTKSKSLIYRYTIFTPQEEMKTILFDSNRMDTLRKVFGIDKYKTIKENTAITIRETKKEIAVLLGKLERLPILQMQLQENKKTISEKHIHLHSLEKNLTILHQELKQKNNVFETIEKKYHEEVHKKKQKEMLQEQLVAQTNQLQELLKKIEQKKVTINEYQALLHENIITEKKDTSVLENTIATTQKQLNDVLQKHAAYKQQKQTLKETIDKLELKISALNDLDDVDALEKTIENNPQKQLIEYEQQEKELALKEQKLLLKKNQIESQIQEANQTAQLLQTQATCPTCHQPMNEHHKQNHLHELQQLIDQGNQKIQTLLQLNEQVQQKKAELFSAKSQLTSQVAHYEKTKEKVIKLKQQHEQKKIFKEDLEQVKHQLSTLQEPHDSPQEIESSLENIKKELKNWQTQNERWQEQQHKKDLLAKEEEYLSNLLQQQINLTKQNEQIKSKILSIVIDTAIQQTYDQQKEYIKGLQEQLSANQATYAAAQKESSLLLEQQTAIQQEIQELQIIALKSQHLSQVLNWLGDFFIPLMTTIEKHVMISIHREFSMLLRNWLSILVDEMDIRLDEEFTPIVNQNGYEIDLDYLSGGEKTSVALAYRLALNKVINDIIPHIKTNNLIILDEPTDGFSTEQLDKVRDVLQQLNMPQSIIVSHEPKMESYVDHVIRIQKIENQSEVMASF